MNKNQIFNIVMYSLLFVAITLFVISKWVAVLLVVALGVLLGFLVMLTYKAILIYKATNREIKQREFDNLMSLQGEEDDPFDVDIEIQKKKKTHNDKISYVIICILATIICAFMFVHLI